MYWVKIVLISISFQIFNTAVTSVDMSTVSMENISQNVVEFKVNIDSIKIEDNIKNGKTFNKIKIDGFGYSLVTGQPSLPYSAHNLISDTKVSPHVEILSIETDTMLGVNLYPTQKSDYNNPSIMGEYSIDIKIEMLI